MSEELDPTEIRERLPQLLQGPPSRLRGSLAEVHPADLAEWMLDLSEQDAWRIFESLDIEERAEVIEEAEDQLREQLVDGMTPRQLSELVEELPADEVADLLSMVEPSVVDQVLRGIDFERAKGLRKLATYDPESAGGVMITEFVTSPLGSRVGDAIKLIKAEGDEVEEGLGLYVVDEAGKPVGYLTDRMLLTHSIHDSVDEVMSDPFSVHVDADQEEAATTIAHYGLSELGVVDDTGALVGTIPLEDAQEVLEEEASEDIHKLVGISPEQQTRLPIYKRVLARLPLQGVTVLGGLLTAWMIRWILGAEAEGAKTLAYVPIVIGLAGNVGVQCSTILVRAFATGEVEPERELSVLGSETMAGILIGLICGGATSLVTIFGGEPSHFALSIGLAIACAVTLAAFLGCAVPMLCRRMGIDPAIIAGPFLITVSDISGTSLYLLVVSLMK